MKAMIRVETPSEYMERNYSKSDLINAWTKAYIQLLGWTHELIRDGEYSQAAATMRAARLLLPNPENGTDILEPIQKWLDEQASGLRTMTMGDITTAKETIRAAQEYV